jgi:cell wall-associated NlpC family hydrolase
LSVRDSARHRASQWAANPLSGVTSALSGRLALVGRSSAVIAVSTGLAATSGLPAQAVGSAAPASSAQTSASNAFALSSTGLGGSPFTSMVSMKESAVISAPSTATVRFESKDFTAKPAPVRRAPKPVAAHAAASVSGHASSASSAAPASSVRGSSVLAIAARYVGIAYRYGGSTPAGFDCSGYTSYVYRQVGKSLPRTANQQLGATTRVSRSQARPGDLVFFLSGGRATHVGIYAGGNLMYDSPHSGASISKRAIYSSAAVFGRFR